MYFDDYLYRGKIFFNIINIIGEIFRDYKSRVTSLKFDRFKNFTAYEQNDVRVALNIC